MKSFINVLKSYRGVLLIVLPVLILIVLRSSGADKFKSDAEDRASVSTVSSGLININGLLKLESEKLLIIRLEPVEETSGHLPGRIISIKPDSILDPANIKLIKKNNGPAVLVSSDEAMSARIWMLLSQMGCRNLYILTSRDNDK